MVNLVFQIIKCRFSLYLVDVEKLAFMSRTSFEVGLRNSANNDVVSN